MKTEKVLILRLSCFGEDVYGNGERTNLQMIKQGMAWHYKQYSKDQELASAEVEARKKQLGLWAEKSPLAPWEWRKGNRPCNASEDSLLKISVVERGNGFLLVNSENSRLTAD